MSSNGRATGHGCSKTTNGQTALFALSLFGVVGDFSFHCRHTSTRSTLATNPFLYPGQASVRSTSPFAEGASPDETSLFCGRERSCVDTHPWRAAAQDLNFTRASETVETKSFRSTSSLADGRRSMRRRLAAAIRHRANLQYRCFEGCCNAAQSSGVSLGNPV